MSTLPAAVQILNLLAAAGRPLSINQLAELADDEQVTVEGTLTHIQHHTNRAGAEYATLTLADLHDPEVTGTVDVWPSTWAALQRHRADRHLPPLTVGDTLLIRGTARQHVTLDAQEIRAESDWPTEDAPPFRPIAETQFVSGFQATRHAIEDGAR